MDGLRIGTVAERSGLSVDTVRFYERRGLIARAPRTPAGYRSYPGETVRRLRFVRRAKALGFTLAEIAELLALRLDGGDDCARVRERTAAKLDDVEARIADLERMRGALHEVLAACHGRQATGTCPILDTLDEEGDAP